MENTASILNNLSLLTRRRAGIDTFRDTDKIARKKLRKFKAQLERELLAVTETLERLDKNTPKDLE